MLTGQDRARKLAPGVFIILLSVTLLLLPASAAEVFDYSPANPEAGQEVTFSVSDQSLYNLSWNFGDGRSGSGSPVTHTYTAPDEYQVTLEYSRLSVVAYLPATGSATRNILVTKKRVIAIDAIADLCQGDTFALTADTDLDEDELVLIEIYSSSFVQAQEKQSSDVRGLTSTVQVTRGPAGMNRISFEADTSTFRPDEYTVRVSAVQGDAEGTEGFNVGDCDPCTSCTSCSLCPACPQCPYDPCNDCTSCSLCPACPQCMIETCESCSTCPLCIDCLQCKSPIFPWIFFIIVPPLGYVAHRQYIRGQARRHCPDLPPSFTIEGGIGIEDEMPGCLNINVEFDGGVEDENGKKMG